MRRSCVRLGTMNVRLGRVARRVRLSVAVVGFAGFTAWDLQRVWTSPVRVSATWVTGTVIGLTLGITSAACWLRAIYRRPASTRTPWWQWATILAWVVALVTAHASRGHVQPAVTSAYIIGALWYDISAFAGCSALLAIVLTSRRQQRRRAYLGNSNPQDRQQVTPQQAPSANA
jgi:hypothetical protein